MFVVLSGEQFKELTPEAQLEYIDALNAYNESLNEANAALAKKAAKAEKEDGKEKSLPSVEIEEEDPSGVEAGTYNWTAPTFTWDDNTVVKVSDLMKDAASKDEKVSQKAQVIISQLLVRKSGLLVKKED